MTTQSQQDAHFMQLALQLAAEAAAAGEVPVGAVVVKDGVVLGRGRNSPIHDHDPSAHAEVQALRAAAQAVGNYRLDGCTLYATLEPCAMCSGAIVHSRIQRLVYGAADSKTGCAGSVLDLFADTRINHHTQVEGGCEAEAATQLLQQFFQDKRLAQRERATPLRPDALRTPEERFPGFELPWESHYVSDLPTLNGLRLHYFYAMARGASQTLLCLHAVPGWTYGLRDSIAQWVKQGACVLAPDLIGFGRSDKPKRVAIHTIAFHMQCLVELLDRLGLVSVALVAHPSVGALSTALLEAYPERLTASTLALNSDNADDAILQAPYPDSGYRAAERAFSSKAFGPRIMGR